MLVSYIKRSRWCYRGKMWPVMITSYYYVRFSSQKNASHVRIHHELLQHCCKKIEIVMCNSFNLKQDFIYFPSPCGFWGSIIKIPQKWLSQNDINLEDHVLAPNFCSKYHDNEMCVCVFYILNCQSTQWQINKALLKSTSVKSK